MEVTITKKRVSVFFITEGELDGDIDSNIDRSKDDEDEGNIISKVDWIKYRIFEG